MTSPALATRETKYSTAVRRALQRLCHATNTELLAEVREQYSDVSATTIHRTTARLLQRKEIAAAPAGRDGTLRYDARLDAHHHFTCVQCGMLCDVTATTKVDQAIAVLKAQVEECQVGQSLTMSGICKTCSKEKV